MSPSPNTNPFEGAEIISAYTQAQAFDDGFLVRIPEKEAKEAGFRLPVILTHAAYATCVELDCHPKAPACQSVSGRLWDVLFMASLKVRQEIKRGNKDSRTTFKVLVNNGPDGPKEQELVLDIGPGDDGSPCVTIGFWMDF